jgi:hypothetical protein
MCLVMLKSLPDVDFNSPPSINKVIGLTDELLYYAYETERIEQNPDSSLVAVLDEVDRVNSYHAHGVRNHWTHARDSVGERGLDVYHEGDSYNFLALAVQARLVKYVRAKLDANQNNMQKRGRPLLDYALRPRRSTPISMRYHSKRDDSSLSVEMVRLLLERGANPNQPVHLNGSTSVWVLFLISMHESVIRAEAGTSGTKVSPNLANAWYQACELLIQYGARKETTLVRSQPTLSMGVVFQRAFGSARAHALWVLLDEKTREDQQAKGSCAVM